MILRRGEARVAWQCGASAKIRNDATVQKNPAFGGANRLPGCVATLARCPASRCAPRLPGKPICRHQIDSIWPDSALGPMDRHFVLISGDHPTAREGPPIRLRSRRVRKRIRCHRGPCPSSLSSSPRSNFRNGANGQITARMKPSRMPRTIQTVVIKD